MPKPQGATQRANRQRKGFRRPLGKQGRFSRAAHGVCTSDTEPTTPGFFFDLSRGFSTSHLGDLRKIERGFLLVPGGFARCFFFFARFRGRGKGRGLRIRRGIPGCSGLATQRERCHVLSRRGLRAAGEGAVPNSSFLRRAGGKKREGNCGGTPKV